MYLLGCDFKMAAFTLVDSDSYFKLGRKIAFFGDGHQERDERFGRRVWVLPTMGGEFVIDRRFGYADGIMGGNLWLLATSEEASLEAAVRAANAVRATPGCILPFPGGVAASGSKAGSRYKFLIASTNHPFCPTLREKLGSESQLPPEVKSVMEIIINGRDLETVTAATYAAIEAAQHTPGLLRISAGNYGGRLGKSFVPLRRQE